MSSKLGKETQTVKLVKQLFSDFRELNGNSKLCLDILEYEDGARIAALSKKSNKNQTLNQSIYLSYSGFVLLKEFLEGTDLKKLEFIMKKLESEKEFDYEG